MQYDQLLLKNLLDSYEKSLLSSGKNKVRIHVSMTFSRRNLPEYFDESSMVYEQIHVAAEDMERRGFLKIQWKNRKPGTIIENVILKEEAVEEVYQYLHRTPKAVNEELTRAVLREYDQKLNKTEEQTVIRAFLRYILERFQDGKSVKEIGRASCRERV